MKMNEILEFSQILCKFIREKVPNVHGLFRTEAFDVDAEFWFTDRCDPDDIGDFAPFMVWLDEITRQNTNEIWVQDQTNKVIERLKQPSGFYYPHSDGSKKVRQSNFMPVYPQNHIDSLLGFNLLYLLTGKETYYDASKHLCDGIAKYAVSRKGFVYGAVIPGLHVYFPRYGYLRHKPVVSGIFIEEFSNFYRISKNEKYLDIAKVMAKAWLDTKPFIKYGVFVDQIYPFIYKPAVATSTLYKMNINMIYGLLALYEILEETWLEDALLKSLVGLGRFRDLDGAYCNAINTDNGEIHDKTVDKALNHAAISTLIDAYDVLKDKSYIELAEKCAKFWIETQSENGLFLQRKKGQKGWNRCEVDPHCDMMVEIGRLYALKGESVYKQSMEKALNALNLFKAKNGAVYLSTDFKSGKVLDKKNELKFMGGTLKGLLSAYTILDNQDIFGERTIKLLMRDR